MSQMLNTEMQYGANCLLLGGPVGVKSSKVQHRSWSDAHQRGVVARRHAAPVAGRGRHELCALVRPPLVATRRGVKRALSVVFRIWVL